MAGSRRVQSARTSSTPRSAKARRTSLLLSTRRLSTWQVTHQAAVKSTNTTLLAAVSSATFVGVNDCHGSAADVVFEAWAGESTSAGASPEKSGHARYAAPTSPMAAANEKPRAAPPRY